jgi:hypothetical protein
MFPSNSFALPFSWHLRQFKFALSRPIRPGLNPVFSRNNGRPADPSVWSLPKWQIHEYNPDLYVSCANPVWSKNSTEGFFN